MNLENNFKDEEGNIFLVQCPKCKKENWSISVASGICCWCGYDANKEN